MEALSLQVFADSLQGRSIMSTILIKMCPVSANIRNIKALWHH